MRVTIRSNDAAFIEALQNRAAKVKLALLQRITYLMLKMQQKIAGEKLQGQVLHHRSGTLAGSIRAFSAEDGGQVLTGRVEGAGGPAWYGRIHEFGGQGAYEIVPTNKKALRWMAGGKAVFAKSVMHPPLPKRAFMAPTLAEMAPEIAAQLQAAVAEGLA